MTQCIAAILALSLALNWLGSSGVLYEKLTDVFCDDMFLAYCIFIIIEFLIVAILYSGVVILNTNISFWL